MVCYLNSQNSDCRNKKNPLAGGSQLGGVTYQGASTI
jgi:hypothetical protein